MDAAAGLTPLLIDAKREYVGQLTDVLAPYVLNRFASLYVAAQRATPKTPVLTFQRALRDIPAWNAGAIQQYTQEVQSKYSFLGDLIAACFVAYVKILSSVKLHQQKPNIRLKLPTNDAFVHKVYVHAAREFYTTPSLIGADRASRTAVVKMAVEASVRDMLPIEDILKAYLGNTVDATDNTMLPGMMTDVEAAAGVDAPPPSPFPAAPPSAAPPPPPPPPAPAAPAPAPPDAPLFASEPSDESDDHEDDFPKQISLGHASQRPQAPAPQAPPPHAPPPHAPPQAPPPHQSPPQRPAADLFSDAEDEF